MSCFGCSSWRRCGLLYPGFCRDSGDGVDLVVLVLDLGEVAVEVVVETMIRLRRMIGDLRGRRMVRMEVDHKAGGLGSGQVRWVVLRLDTLPAIGRIGIIKAAIGSTGVMVVAGAV